MSLDTCAIRSAVPSYPEGMGRTYTEDILDRKTGELISINKGDWVTMAELAQLAGVGRRQATTILREMGLLEIVKAGGKTRHRIRKWVSDKGWGRTNWRKGDKFPFDVLSPEAVQWVFDNWGNAAAVVGSRIDAPVRVAANALTDFKTSRGREDMPLRQQAVWLKDHFPDLTHQQIADVLSVSRQLIDKFMKSRDQQLKKWKTLKASYR